MYGNGIRPTVDNSLFRTMNKKAFTSLTEGEGFVELVVMVVTVRLAVIIMVGRYAKNMIHMDHVNIFNSICMRNSWDTRVVLVSNRA